MSVHTQVCCDGAWETVDQTHGKYMVRCQRYSEVRTQYPEEGKVHMARARLRHDNWSVGLPGGRDLCPECAKREKTR